MRITTHIYSSLLFGGFLFTITTSLQIGLFSFLSGVFIDIDHVFDYLIFSKGPISVKRMFQWFDEVRWKRVILVFHSYELLFVLSVLSYFLPFYALTGILLGMGLHLLIDQVGNRYFNKLFCVNQFFYFLIYRIIVGFKKDKLLNFVREV